MPGAPTFTLDNSAAIAARAVRTAFADTYTAFQNKLDPEIANLMDLGLPSDKNYETYAYRETLPYVTRWKSGEPIPEDSSADVSWNTYNYVWAKRVNWRWDEEKYDQLGGVVEYAQGLAKQAAYLPEDIFWQLLLSLSDEDLLPVVPTAPDGVALFSATDGGGGDRYGLSGGNIETGGGVATAAAIRTDFYQALARYAGYEDTKGKPLYKGGQLARAVYTILYGRANIEVFEEAFKQRLTLDTAGVTNIILDSDKSVKLIPTPRITDNDWYISCSAAPKKAFYQQIVEDFSDNLTDFENSDITRTFGTRSYQVQAIQGYGIGPAHGWIQVNN